MHWRLCCVAVPLRAIRGTQALDGPPASTRSGTPELRLERSGRLSSAAHSMASSAATLSMSQRWQPKENLEPFAAELFERRLRPAFGDHAARLRRVQVQGKS